MKAEAIQNLRELGLNQLEAEVYYFLLQGGGQTAYAVGKQLKKPTANIYKAIETLTSLGAVVIEDGKNKICHAVKPELMMASLQHRFASKAAAASNSLQNIAPHIEEEKTFTLESVELVLEKCIELIDASEAVLVIDAFPESLKRIQSSLQAAAKRGVKVLVQAYKPIEIDGVQITLTQCYEKVLKYWNSEQLNLVMDGKQSVSALFSQNLDRVIHASWSSNVYLSCLLHAGRLCEQTVHKLMELPESADKLQKMESILNQQAFFRNSHVPGIEILKTRYGKNED